MKDRQIYFGGGVGAVPRPIPSNPTTTAGSSRANSDYGRVSNNQFHFAEEPTYTSRRLEQKELVSLDANLDVSRRWCLRMVLRDLCHKSQPSRVGAGSGGYFQ